MIIYIDGLSQKQIPNANTYVWYVMSNTHKKYTRFKQTNTEHTHKINDVKNTHSNL